MLNPPTGAPTDYPTESQVRSQLERMLASELFLRSPRLTSFLRFITEQALAGMPLKEQVLGAELYEKGEAFDGASDPIVRVDARRLRDKLREYYFEFPNDPILISLPKGLYTPTFRRNGDNSRAGAPDPDPSPERETSTPLGQQRVNWGGRTTMAAGLAILGILGVGVAPMLRPPPKQPDYRPIPIFQADKFSPRI